LLNPLQVEDQYILKGDSLHHLVNVVRVEVGEKLLLLNGEGLFVETVIESLNKKELILKKLADYRKERAFNLDLALGMPKREALELCLKECTELGFRRIFLIRSDYSQMRFPEEERVHKLLVSALEQSNAPYLPKVIQATWEEVPFQSYEEVILLDSQSKPELETAPSSRNEEKLLIVGPEGGFSPEELKLLHSLERVRVVNLPTPILRTPTAVATGAGMILQNLLK
jgi:16S rRNA (uracil1498-N3)-methyltransferase